MPSAAGKRRQAPDATTAASELQDRLRESARSGSAAAVDIARTVAHHVAWGWWQSLVEREAPPIGLPMPAPTYVGPLLDLGPDVAAAAVSLGKDLANLPIATAAAEIGRLYCFLLPPKHRGTNGVFYTPTPLVTRLLDDAEAAGHDWAVGKAIDPSCGGGAFLVDAADRMVNAMGGADPAIVVASISARLRGWDLDPFAAWLSHLCVEAVLLPQVIASGKRLSPVTETRDSLAGWDGHEGQYSRLFNAAGRPELSPPCNTSFAKCIDPSF
jgi:adenine-specific DNA-methyltransferase